MITSSGRSVRHENASVLLVGLKNGAVILQNCSSKSDTLRSCLTVSSNPIYPIDAQEERKHRFVQETPYIPVCGCVILTH